MPSCSGGVVDSSTLANPSVRTIHLIVCFVLDQVFPWRRPRGCCTVFKKALQRWAAELHEATYCGVIVFTLNLPLRNRAGSWVRINTAGALGVVCRDTIERGQAKLPRQYNCCVPGCTNSHSCRGAAFLLGIFTCPVPPNDPECPKLLIPAQFPTRIGNGQFNAAKTNKQTNEKRPKTEPFRHVFWNRHIYSPRNWKTSIRCSKRVRKRRANARCCGMTMLGPPRSVPLVTNCYSAGSQVWWRIARPPDSQLSWRNDYNQVEQF